MNNKKVMPTTEIVGAILQTHANDESLEKFKSSPSEFLQEQGIDLMHKEVGVVENESAMVHLCLPYYDGMDSIGSGFIEDTDLESITGGEIFLIATSVVGISAGLIAGAGIITGVIADAKAKKGLNLDGSAK